MMTARDLALLKTLFLFWRLGWELFPRLDFGGGVGGYARRVAQDTP